LDYGRLKPWVSGNDIRVGKPWREELDAALKGATAAVGILTPAALRSPWVNFEAGYLYSRLASFVPLRLSHEISGPLQTLQWVDGTKKIDLVRMLLRLTGEDSDREKRLAKIWVRDKYKPWIECIRTAMPDDGPLTDAIDR